MKPVVRQVGGEWRVWVPIDGQKDAMRRQVFVGDKLQTHDTGGRVLTYIAIPGAVGFALSVINASPGIPCEVEMPPEPKWYPSETGMEAGPKVWVQCAGCQDYKEVVVTESDCDPGDWHIVSGGALVCPGCIDGYAP